MAKNDIWVCKDGTRMKMCEMSDSHLKNAINLFKNHKEDNPDRWKYLITEHERRQKNEPDDPIENRFEILDL